MPKSYHPFDKECLEPVQGLYGEGVKIMMVLILIVQIVTFYRICSTSGTNCNYLNLIWVPLVLYGVTAFMCTCILCKYENLCDEYKAINPNRAHEENAESLERVGINHQYNQIIKMRVIRVTTRQKIGMGYSIPAGSTVQITIQDNSNRPNPDQIKEAFERKFGIKVGVCELCMLTYEELK